jgi:hypothetical protein
MASSCACQSNPKIKLAHVLFEAFCKFQRNTPNASIHDHHSNRANPIQIITTTQSPSPKTRTTPGKIPKPQKRHQRIPSQTMQLSKSETNTDPQTKTTGLNPRREANQISLAPRPDQVPARRSVEAASIPPGNFRQPGKPRKTVDNPDFLANHLI